MWLRSQVECRNRDTEGEQGPERRRARVLRPQATQIQTVKLNFKTQTNQTNAQTTNRNFTQCTVLRQHVVGERKEFTRAETMAGPKKAVIEAAVDDDVALVHTEIPVTVDAYEYSSCKAEPEELQPRGGAGNTDKLAVKESPDASPNRSGDPPANGGETIAPIDANGAETGSDTDRPPGDFDSHESWQALADIVNSDTDVDEQPIHLKMSTRALVCTQTSCECVCTQARRYTHACIRA